METIRIFDTTLRDGEQSPGASLNVKEKIEIARMLSALGVDVIEGGFPITSEGDFEAVRRISEEVKGVSVAGLARAVPADIDRAWEALQKAERPRIHVFLATSAIHRQFKLQKAKEEILRLSVEMVRRARNLCGDIEFSPEDASRTEGDFLCQVVEAVIAAGATTVNIPDTVGWAVPDEFAAIIRTLKEKVPNVDRAVLSVHCHNDLGLAVANSLAAVRAGARQVECTVNGIGERAGNASLEEIVMAVKTRSDFYRDFRTGVATTKIVPASRLVSKLTGIFVQRNKAIVGDNAFAHEAGIHQDGILKERTTYEIIRPEDVGFGATRLVIGKHSGRHAILEKVRDLGFTLSKKEMEEVYHKIKALADKKKEVFDEDITALIEDAAGDGPQAYVLGSFHVSGGTSTVPTATIRLLRGGELIQDAACGDGPVDAVCRALDRITGLNPTLKKFDLRAVTGGKDAQGEVTMVVEFQGMTLSGRGVSTDIIEASVHAYLNALNKIAHRLARTREAAVEKTTEAVEAAKGV